MNRDIEQKILDTGLNAPRLTPCDIESVIVDETYYKFPNTTVTICLLTLKNGYNVTGKSACVSLENFNEEIGKTVAKEDAISQIWQLEGYLLTENIHKGTLND